MSDTHTVVRHPSAVAGRFYPAEPARLSALLDDLFTMARPPSFDPSTIRAVVVPHGSYLYSGLTAASAFRAVEQSRGRIRHVAVLGPAHRGPAAGASAPTADRFETPLGAVPINTGRLAELAQVHPDDRAHLGEHSIEVQLPLIQRALGDVDVIPLVVGRTTEAQTATLLGELATDPETLIVISSDISHRHPYQDAHRLDAETIHRITTLRGRVPRSTACGARLINGLVTIARDLGWRSRLLAACNSGDATGSTDDVVGYASFAFCAESPQ